MKNEDFDESIRQKLESLNQSYTEGDIDKVHHHVLNKRRFTWNGSSGSWLIYSLSAAAITLVTAWMVLQFNENNKETGKQDSLQEQSITNQPDTAGYHDRPSEKVTFIPSKTVNETIHSTPGKESGSTSNEMRKIANKPEPFSPPLKVIQENRQTAITEPGIEKVISPDQATTQSNSNASESAVSALPGSKPVAEPSISNQETKIKAETVSRPEKELSVNQPEENPLVDTFSKTENKSETVGTPQPEKTEQTTKTSFALFKVSSVRFGADLQVSNQALGAGFTGEILLKNHFGFKTGILYNTNHTEHYLDKADMFGHHQHGFNHRIENHLADKEHVSDVTIRNSLLLVPVSFSYNVPLKRNYSVSFSLGTNIDIYLNQKLSYTYKPDSAGHSNDHFETSGKVTPFNSLVVSAGLEKQWKSWVIQVRPFVAPKLKEVFYKPKELEFGVSVGVKYGFGKL